MEKLIHLDIVTPEKVEMTAEVEMVIIPATEGELGIMFNHAPLVTEFVPGVLRVFETGSDGIRKEVALAVGGGFAEVHENRIIVLADTAELPDEIDLERAQLARKRAKERLEKPGQSAVDAVRAELALRKAMARIKVGERHI